MPLYCVPFFIALVGPYYMYHIRTILALNMLNCTIDSQKLLVLKNALNCPVFAIGLGSTEILRPWASVSIAHEQSVISGKGPLGKFNPHV